MRKTHTQQLSFLPAPIPHPHAKELESISDILDRNPTISERVTQDLVAAKKRSDRCAPCKPASKTAEI